MKPARDMTRAIAGCALIVSFLAFATSLGSLFVGTADPAAAYIAVQGRTETMACNGLTVYTGGSCDLRNGGIAGTGQAILICPPNETAISSGWEWYNQTPITPMILIDNPYFVSGNHTRSPNGYRIVWKIPTGQTATNSLKPWITCLLQAGAPAPTPTPTPTGPS